MNQDEIHSEAASILVVDDTPANLKLLVGVLKERGYKVRPVPSGARALEAARIAPPELILLDINMPEMDGYEVCTRLKADPLLKEIPVIFISALSETLDKVKAFQVGGVDYVTKPFQFEEVEARVKTHLELRRQKRNLAESYDKLRQLETLRDNLVNMVVHDMRSPLTAMSGFLELVQMVAPDKLDQEEQGWVDAAYNKSLFLREMVTQLLDLRRLENGVMPIHKAECDLAGLAHSCLDAVRHLAGDRSLEFESIEPMMAPCDQDLLRRIISNLLDNALKFTPSKGQIKIAIDLIEQQSKVRISVSNTGYGIPATYHQKIFELFGQVDGEKRKLGTGLGLAFCKLAVEAHGGEIGLESEIGKGSTFLVTLPMTS